MILYGISTCDTCKKAIKALSSAGYDVSFRDIRKDPLSEVEIGRIVNEFGERSINRASPSYRGLSDFLKASSPVEQIQFQPTVMKRPVIEHDGRWSIAWDDKAQSIWVK